MVNMEFDLNIQIWDISSHNEIHRFDLRFEQLNFVIKWTCIVLK